jgi:hypothetical protein
MTPMHEMRQQAAEKDSYASLRSPAGQPQGVAPTMCCFHRRPWSDCRGRPLCLPFARRFIARLASEVFLSSLHFETQ